MELFDELCRMWSLDFVPWFSILSSPESILFTSGLREKNSLLFEACKQYSQKRLCRRGTPKKKITVIRMLGSNVCISVENRLIKTLLIDTRDEIQKPSIKYIRISLYRSRTDYSTSRIFSRETLCQNLLNFIIALNPKMRLKYVSRVI